MMTEMVKDTMGKEKEIPINKSNNTTKKNKRWTYIIFLLIGIVSFIIPIVSGDFFILLLLICSILFAIAMYKFKKQPLVIFSLFIIIIIFGVVFMSDSPFMSNSPLGLLLFYGAQDDATTSTSIYIESSTENLTIYIPVLLDENKNVLKMYENPQIMSNVTTSVIDTEYGKALMISRTGLGDYLFNWNEVPGKDTDRFVEWLENERIKEPGDKLDIRKTDDGNTLTVNVSRSGYRYDIDYTYRINEMKEMESGRGGSNGFFITTHLRHYKLKTQPIDHLDFKICSTPS